MEPFSNVRLVLSAVLLLVALWLQRRSARSRACTLAVVLAAVAAIFLYVLHFVADYFTAQGVNEAVIYHLRYGLSGAGFSEYAGLMALAGVATAACIAILLWSLRGRSADPVLARYGNAAALACAGLSLAIQPASAAVYRVLSPPSWGSVAAPRTGGTLHDEFAGFYADAGAVALRQPARNLVLIYAESLERTYFDERLFPGLVRDLRALERSALSFTQVEEVAGTGWTIAGMVASQCGVPLQAAEGNLMSGADRFLPAATCLGDLLRRDGYHLVYYGGAPMRFAGKGKFYETHGFHEVAGRDELRGRLPDPAYVSAWGLFDDSLFELAFEKYAELGRTQARFALLMLTLDTHHPDGHPSAKCRDAPYADGRNPILNAVRCSDRLIGEFVARIRASPWGKDTVVVIASDHLAMRNSAHDLLQQGTRRNLFMILDPAGAGRQVDTRGSALDLAATLLPVLGYQGGIGLGTDLAAADAQAAARAAHIRGRLAAWGEPLSRLWSFPRIEHYLEVDAERALATIDGRSFAVPSFIEMDSRMKTVIRFPGGPGGPMALVRANAPGRPFVLVAGCTERDPRLPVARTCVFAGQGSEIRSQLIVERAARFTPEQIRGMTGWRP